MMLFNFYRLITTLTLFCVITVFGSGYALAAKIKYKEKEVANGATIKGFAKWKGDIPTLPPITVFKHMDKCGQEVFNPALVVS